MIDKTNLKILKLMRSVLYCKYRLREEEINGLIISNLSDFF